jgi:predicted porin
VDIWNINVKYSNGPFFAGASYIALEGSSDQYVNVDLDLDQWVIGLGYSHGPFNVGFIYEQGTYNEWGLLEPTFQRLGFQTDTPWNAYLTGSYAFGNNLISAAYGQLDTGVSDQDAMQNYLVGYQYNFSKRTRIWVEYIGRSADDNLFYGDQNAVSIGTRVDF